MSAALNLLGEVRCRGQAVVGDRPQALLAARDGRPVRADELIELIGACGNARRAWLHRRYVAVSRPRGPRIRVVFAVGYGMRVRARVGVSL